MDSFHERLFGKTNEEIQKEREALQKRNVVDHYKYWLTEDILKDLDSKRHNFSVLCSNVQYDFNLGAIIRNANAFLAKEVIIYGRKKIDTRACVGTHKYTHFKHVKEIEDIKLFQENNPDSVLVGFDDLPQAKPLDQFVWNQKKHVVMCFGQESIGLTSDIITACQDIVYIRQYGSVRSLNVGCASAVAMFHFCQQINKG